MRLRDPLLILLVAGAVLMIPLAIRAVPALARGAGETFNLGLYLLANLVFFVDFFDFLLRLYFQRIHTSPAEDGGEGATSVPLEIGNFAAHQMKLHLRPYALLASVHNAENQLEDFLEAMAPYRERLWIIDDASTDGTRLRLQRSGFRCLAGFPNQKKPGAIKVLLASLPAEIETVVVLDPDAHIEESGRGRISDLERVIFEFQRSRMAALCPRLAIREDGWLARLQALEYCISFSLLRKSLGDHCVTSGIAIYRRDALARVLETHGLSVYAEDLKNALLLLAQGEKIYYDGRLVIRTEAKRTCRDWFSQRVGWYYGLIKVYGENLREVQRAAQGRFIYAYQFLVYVGCFTLLLHPFKLAALALLTLSTANGLDYLLGLGWIPDVPATDPAYFLFAYLKYTVLVAVIFPLGVKKGERLYVLPAVPLYFFYALAQILPVTVGYLNWFSHRLWGRRLYRDHFQDLESPSGEGSLGMTA